MEKINSYMQSGVGIFLYTLLLLLFKALTLSLEEANLDRTSFIANNDFKEDANTDEENAYDAERGGSSSLLQQELEAYLNFEMNIVGS